MNLSQSDLQYIEQQLGREPRNVIEISVRSKDGRPLVIKTQPVIDNEIFPTLYYLVSKEIIEQVLRLESENLLTKMQERVDSDSDFRQRFLESQQAYRQERNRLVTQELRDSQKEALETGIGGVKDFTRIKCLHCHLAHYLATNNNPVGKEAWGLVSKRPDPMKEKTR